MLNFDHELKIGSTTKGLKLVVQDGQALYKVSDLISSSVENYQEELRFTQSDWKGGHGKHDFDQYEQDRYFEGASIDTTKEGRFFLGPLIHEVKEDDDTYLDSHFLGFKWFEATGEWLGYTTSKIYRYIKDDTGIDTDEALDATETAVTMDADATSAMPVGSIIIVDSEFMEVTVTGTTITVIRGVHGSTAATHDTNKDVSIYKWTAATTAVAGCTDLEEFDGIMYAAKGAATTYVYSSDGATWTATDLTSDKAVKFLSGPSASGFSNVLWKFKTPNELNSTTDGRTVGAGGQVWSSVAYLGDTSDNITNMFIIASKLFIPREDNLYYYTATGRVEALMNDLRVSRDANNFKYVTMWKTSAYFSLMTGLGELTAADSFDSMGPITEIDDIGKKGTVVGLTNDTEFLYVAVDEGTNTVIYKGREITRYQGLRWEWCPFIALLTNQVNTIAVCQHSTNDKRLWFSYGTGTNYSSGYVLLSDDPTADSSYRFAASGWVRMPYVYGTDPYWVKNYSSVITETEACTANLTVTPKYRKNSDTSATGLTAAIVTNGYVKTDVTTEVSCNRIQSELHLATNSALTSPEVKYFQLRGQEQPETLRIHDCTYSVVGTEFETTQDLRDFLRTGTTATATIRFSDLNFTPDATGGTENTDWVHVKMMGRPVEIPVYHEKDKIPELAVQVRFREVNV